MHVSLDLGGTVRDAEPGNTISRAGDIGKALGVTRVANVTGLDSVGIPVWIAIRPLAYSLSVSQGKGVTHDLARASALMETIELAHAELFQNRGPVASVTACRKDERYLPPHHLPLRSDADLEDSIMVEWTRCLSLYDKREHFVPADLFRLDFRSGDNEGPFLGTSNGLASGNTYTEAVLHGLCEIIERDQVSFCIVRNSLAGPGSGTEVGVSTIEDPALCAMLDLIRSAGLILRIWYATTNIDVPSFVALVHGPDMENLYPIRAKGFGAHPLKRVALSRAVTEALQSRLTYISGSRDDRLWKSYADSRSVNVSTEDIDPPDSSPPSVDFAQIPEYQGAVYTGAMLDWMLARSREAGLDDAFVVDLTRSDFELPVVWVFVPELEHYGLQPDYLPGRRMIEYMKDIPEMP